ncbi:lipoprotein [Erwinia sp. Leaf53]|uniref:LPS translocon maturation chaperone LptM n=1 Tax=Erwinia sp. Leaf53 TaxID=1736225 RepID=UPI0006F59885|nr:lipoprotein [Erwinia sp. Leaf53]KQN60297.1 hypothetical protein ASF13_22450 [Erwinia sp. Leaf53]
MKTQICRLALILAAASLAGCGLKGPLYFPKDEPTQPQTAATASATANNPQAAVTSPGQSVPAAQ